MTRLEKLMENVTPEPNSGCWLWLGNLNRDGYTRARFNGKRTTGHRVFYQLVKGSIPEGLTLDHKCRVRSCVNPDHLEPVAQGENVRRGLSPIALNMNASHCKNGHPFSGDNLRINPDGERACRACASAAARRHRERRGIAPIPTPEGSDD